ncbi:MAG: hypothetical protein J5580_01095 [Clostridia bacterium]|nr:hypothetical protein [Clostridia bacterium]
MNKIWNTMVDAMDQLWDKTIRLLAKLNTWIPLSAVLIAGLGLLSVVLILAICGCVLRKRLVPHWLIWTYFTFAIIIIMAHTGNNLAAIVEAVEIPVLIILCCYILLLLFRRRPRYVYVEKNVYERQLAKGRVYQVSADGQVMEKQDKKNKKNKKDAAAREVEYELETESVVETSEEKADAKVGNEINEQKTAAFEVEKVEAAKLAAAEEAARAAREAEKVAERKTAEQAVRAMETNQREIEPVKRVDKNDFLTARTVRPTMTSSTATVTVDLPTVNPIPDKSYEPTREPTIVTRPISQTIPGLKMTGSSTTTRYSSTANRPTITTAARPSTYTITRPTTTTSTFNRTTSSTASKTPTTSTTRSTDDIMAAIERLRNSMKK